MNSLQNIFKKTKWKYTLCIILIFLIANYASGQSFAKNRNNSSLLEKSKTLISLSFNSLSLKQAIKEVAHKGNISITYQTDIVPNKKVSINLKDISIQDALNAILKETELYAEFLPSGAITIKLKKQGFLNVPVNIVTGLVTDAETGNPMPGVNVIVKNSSTGTNTDINGKYEITVPEGIDTLVYTFIGFQNIEIPVDKQTTINVSLRPNQFILNDVVVVGYGTLQKSNLTTSISQLKSENFKDFPITSFEQAMAGQLAGVQVMQNSGAPGSALSIRIRGVNSITAGTQPLIVVDGLPITDGSTSNINPDDIASIETLKDASAAAIYGSRGSNGVILITTKRGVSGKPKFSFNAYQGVQHVTKKVSLMNSYEHAQVVAAARNNLWFDLDPVNHLPTDDNSLRSANTKIPTYILPYLQGQKGLTNTDWQNAIFRDAPIQNYDLSVSGGNEKSNFYISGNYFNQQGIVINSGFERYSLRTNFETSLSNKLKFGVNLSPSFTNRNIISEQDHKGNGIIISALLADPSFPVYNSDGSLNISQQINQGNIYGMSPVENPVALATQTTDKVGQLRLLGGSFLSLELIKGLTIKTYLGGDYNDSRENYFRPSAIGTYKIPAPSQANGTSKTGRTWNWLWENTINYSYTFNDEHHFSILAGYTSQKEYQESNSLNASNFPNDQVQTLNAGLVTSGSSSQQVWTLLSYVGRVNYSYKDKYLLSASLRRDGSSRFGPNTKWGYFPSASIGWRVSNESFFPENNIISDLKIRGSYGVTGNFQIPNYGSYALLSTDNYVLGNKVVNGQAPSTSPNPNISWEKKDMINGGIEIGLLGNRINITADYYYANTNGLLLNVPVPAYSGYTTSLQNLGQVRNEGWELGISNKQNFGKLEWIGSLNFSQNKNKVISLGPGQNQIISSSNVTRVGSPIGSYFGYQILGVFKNGDEVSNYPHLATGVPGTYKYADLNNDGKITDADRTILGNFFPSYTFGFSSAFRYRNFDLNFLIQGVEGTKIFNQSKVFTINAEGWGNASEGLYNGYYKSTDNPGSGFARPNVKTPDKLYETSNYMIEDGSFVRVRNITIGYSLPAILTRKVFIEKARIYASALNPFTFTGYSGYNPEVSTYSTNQLNPGIDYGPYPVAKSLIIGLNINF